MITTSNSKKTRLLFFVTANLLRGPLLGEISPHFHVETHPGRSPATRADRHRARPIHPGPNGTTWSQTLIILSLGTSLRQDRDGILGWMLGSSDRPTPERVLAGDPISRYALLKLALCPD